MTDKTTWYRQLSSPGVEFHFRVARGAPKRYELVIRSIVNPALEQTHEIPDPGIGVTHYLVAAGFAFATQIQQEILSARKRKLDAIAAREAADEAVKRTVPEGDMSQPEGAGQGEPVKNDTVPANPDNGAAEKSDESPGRDVEGRGSRRRGKSKARAGDAPTVSEARSGA